MAWCHANWMGAEEKNPMSRGAYKMVQGYVLRVGTWGIEGGRGEAAGC